MSPNDQGHYSFEGEVGLIETLTLRNNATERVHVRVRDIDSDKTHRGADIPPGETVTMRFHIPIHTGNSFIESTVDGVNLTIVEALGVRFEELLPMQGIEDTATPLVLGSSCSFISVILSMYSWIVTRNI